MKFISTQGYKNSSPDVNNPINVIPSNRITMKDVDFPVHGVDNLGNEQIMMPGGEYLFGGDYVIETPYASGGEMIRRADGSYSRRGLWDNIRANAGSGKEPTKEMLEQERKISKQWGGLINPLLPIATQLVKSAYDYFTGDDTPTPATKASNKNLNATNQSLYKQGHGAYWDKSQQFQEQYKANNEYNYSDKNAIGLTSGRFNGAQLSPQMVDDIVRSSKANGVDPWLMLSLVGRESTFGSGSEDNKMRAGDRQNLVSGWNVAEDYQPYEFNRFLADNKVPGVTVIKDAHGWNYDVEDKAAVNQYLQKHPELLNKYNKKLESTPALGNLNSFDLAARRIKNTGVQNYNPGDPRYSNMVTQDMQLLKKDPALVNYMKSRGYYREDGGSINNEINYSNMNYKQQGGEPETNSLSPQDLNNWNEFVKYAKKSGASQDDRYNHDKKLGYELIKKYNEENPNAAIDKNKVKDYQSYFLNMAAGNTPSGQMGVKTANSFKNGISRVDGFLGLKTLNQMVPKVATEVNGVRTEFGSDFARANEYFQNPKDTMPANDGLYGQYTRSVPQASKENLKKFVNYDDATREQQQAFDDAMLARKKQEIAAQVRKPVVTSGNPANYQEFLASGQAYAPAPEGGFYVKQEGGEMQMQQQNMQPQQQAGPDITDALGEISMLLEGGTSEDEIMTMLTEQGVSQEDAASIIQSAMNDIVEDGMEEEDADLETEDIENDDEEDSGEISNEDDFNQVMDLLEDGDTKKKYGGIHINPKKKGTFKAQATKMGMSVQEAAEHILANKEEYSPAMVKKANFAKNFAKELGGELYEMKQGGSIPPRYKNMGFTKVGAKKQSTRPGKKWMVLAKKGDKYKVVHGGWKGMKDFSQHHSEKRQDRFWDRMGGRDSAQAKDPFSPLYWHKRFGTWAEGGQTKDERDMVNGIADILSQVKNPQNRAEIAKQMVKDFKNQNVTFDYSDFMDMSRLQEGGEPYDYYAAGDQRFDKTESHTINSLKNNAWNRGLATANTLGDPRNMVWALPNKGLLGTIKGIAGAAAGLSGAVLGYEKLFAKPKTTEYIVNPDTKESGTFQDVTGKRKERQDKLMDSYRTPEMYQDSPINEKRRKDNMIPSGPIGPGDFDGGYPSGPSYENMARYGGAMQRYQDGGTFKEWFVKNSTRPDVMQNMGDQAKLEEMWKAESAQQPVVANTSGPAEVATSVGGIETAQTPGGNPQPGNTSGKVVSSWRGDSAGVIAANNALAGFGMVNQVLDARKSVVDEYNRKLRESGNTMEKYNAQNAVNPFGNYTLNAGPASNFGLVANTPIQDFGTKMSSARFGGLIPFIPATRHYAEGGEFYADEDEIKRILAMGGEIEYLD